MMVVSDQAKKRKLYKDILVIHPWKVAYVRVPKAANSSIKESLADALGLPQVKGLPRTKDQFWQEIDQESVQLISTKRYATQRRYRRYFCFSVTREPISRVISCYKNKIVRNASLQESMIRDGFKLGMTFPEFVETLAKTTDMRVNVHLRSQHTMLCYEGKVLPDLIVPMHELASGWNKIREEVQKAAGVELPQLDVHNSTAELKDTIEVDARLEALIRERYAEDYRLLFPNS